MRKLYLAKWFALALLLTLISSLSLPAQQGEHAGAAPSRGDRHSAGWDKAMKLKGPPEAPKFPKIGAEVERVVLDNGMVVYVQEDHRLPLLDVIVMVRTGKYYETPDELGVSALTGELLRAGGTKTLPPEQLDERIDYIAADLNVSMEDEQCRVTLNVPQKDADEGLSILAKVLREPQFEESRLELAKRQAIFSLRSSNDTPGPMLRREFARLMYTAAHPAGRTPTVERIGEIKREDLIRFYQKYFHPNEIMIGLTGDFKKPEMLDKVKKFFGDWPKAEVTLPPLPQANAQPKPGVYYIPKPVPQSSIRIGHWGTNRNNPDRFAIDLMNNILGGSDFSSRITQRVRNDEGLAYDAGTAFPTSQRDTSFFIAVAQTKTESTVKAIDSMIDEIRKMTTGRISRNEFQTAKEMFLYSYVFRYSEPSRALAALMRVEYDRLPADYLQKEFAGYEAVTTEDIERVGKKYLHPDQLTVFVVGDYAKFSTELARLGKPQQIQPLEFGDGNRNAAREGVPQ
ncbi:MAG: insulinase family protein [Acidobacteria bacterium]|nr:insulinase family protein [Acidobacteriota bacterium]